MTRTTAVIVGAGQCGLAMSAHLTRRGIDHVLLERGAVANSWRTERWDSLTLLTPNWQCRLPGYRYEGNDPDGYRNMTQVVDMLSGYAQSIAAPVQDRTRVTKLTTRDGGYDIRTDRGDWQARVVVLASGACNLPKVPACAAELPAGIASVTPMDYRRPSDLPEGGVLVVGGSATGVQLAHEIQASGRQVWLSTGEHVRVPRLYRGRDIKWWMDAAGVLDELWTEVDDIKRARRVPSLQLAGTRDHSSLDLNTLSDAGVEIVGKLAAIRDGKALFSGGLPNHCALADLKMGRLLDTIDEWAEDARPEGIAPPERFAPTRVPDTPRLDLRLDDGTVRSVLWATGFRPDYSWLDLPVMDRKGGLVHDGGVLPAPGAYVMGLNFLRRRKSSLIDGADADAADLSEHIGTYLGGRADAA